MTVKQNPPIHGGCCCGAFSFAAAGEPLTRFLCHCLFCQDFTGEALADVLVFRPGKLEAMGEEALIWTSYRGPPNLRRGRCRTCRRPALESMGRSPFKLMFVPSASVVDQTLLPAPRLHAFYNRRVADADDALPKYAHYWPSQIAITRSVLGL